MDGQSSETATMLTTLYSKELYQESWLQDNISFIVLLLLVNAFYVLRTGSGALAIYTLSMAVVQPWYWQQITCPFLLPLVGVVQLLKISFPPRSHESGSVSKLIEFFLGKSLMHRLCRFLYLSCIMGPVWPCLIVFEVTDPGQCQISLGQIFTIVMSVLLYSPMVFLCVWVLWLPTTS